MYFTVLVTYLVCLRLLNIYMYIGYLFFYLLFVPSLGFFFFSSSHIDWEESSVFQERSTLNSVS